jgi:hypothetical protein
MVTVHHSNIPALVLLVEDETRPGRWGGVAENAGLRPRKPVDADEAVAVPDPISPSMDWLKLAHIVRKCSAPNADHPGVRAIKA